MPRLDPQSKDKLVLAAKQVYFAYLNLKNLNSRSNPTNKQSENLTAFITALSEKISAGNTKFDLQLGDKKLKVFVDGEKVRFELTPPTQTPLAIKGITQYTPSDIAQHLAGNTFKIHKDEAGFKFSALIPNDGSEIEIGGPDKMDLHSLHISNLGRIIGHLQSEKDCDNNMLVSLTTGSGKTFTQALFMLALHLAKVNGVFAIPEALLVQFENDLPRLLPENLVKTFVKQTVLPVLWNKKRKKILYPLSTI